MRWALLGAGNETQSVARILAAAPEIEWIAVSPAEWEGLLARGDVDAVVIPCELDESLRAELLKKLVAAQVCVVAVHPATDMLTAYEVEVIRRDSGGAIVPFASGWQHPAWDLLSELMSLGESSPLGRPEQLTFERRAADRRLAPIRTQFSQDVHLIRRLLGNITSVNAVGVTRDNGSWTSLAVHFTSELGCSATWSIAAPNAAETRVTVSGSESTATLGISGDSGSESWELRDSQGYRELFPPGNDAADLIEKVKRTLAGREPNPTWADACLDLEVADGAERSLRRKRGIDLHTTDRSEEKTFKGVMAAAGCLVLVAILFVFLGVAMWDGLRSPFREANSRRATAAQPGDEKAPEVHRDFPLWVRLWPVYPVVAFLLLQLLLVVARQKPDANASSAGK